MKSITVKQHNALYDAFKYDQTEKVNAIVVSICEDANKKLTARIAELEAERDSLQKKYDELTEAFEVMAHLVGTDIERELS